MSSKYVFFVLMLLISLQAHAAPKANAKAASPDHKHQKVIDFDDDLVEGVNKRPWDSLSQISDRNKRKNNHLYRKRIGFKTENQETLYELRYVR